MPIEPWPEIGNVDPRALTGARLEAHHASQIVVALGISYLPAREDDSHTSLEWLGRPGALAGAILPAPLPFRGALRLADLTLLLLDQAGAIADEFGLTGRVVDQAYQWLRGQVERRGLKAETLTSRKHYTIPAHPVETGRPFAGNRDHLGELSRYYAGAALALESCSHGSGGSPVRCWPHHFDIATLMAPGDGKTIGAGLSPGDNSYPEPYYYVTPWPYPSGELLPIAAGHWHTTGWTGAVLPATALRGQDPAAQAALVSRFLDSAIATCELLLGISRVKPTTSTHRP
jgi:hypothetical protein